jgi:predicted nucleic acid-binding protein
MRRVFADSLYWIAVSNPMDQWHAAAMQAGTAVRGAEIVTTEEMLSEFLTAFRHTPQLRAIAARRVLQIYQTTRVIPQPAQSFQAGFARYLARPDKKFSLADCVSMVTMRQEGIIDILTHDDDFRQEGFTVLF